MSDLNSFEPPVRLTPEPDLDSLLDVFRSCSPLSQNWNRVRDSEDIRFAVWENQEKDGRRYDTPTEPAFPWDGASDTRVFLADSIIEEQVDVLCSSFWRSGLRAQGTKAENMEESSNATRLLDYLVTSRLRAQLNREVELAAQYHLTYGWCVLQICWERTLSHKRYQLTLDQVVQMAQQLPPEHVLSGLAQLVINPETERQAADLIKLQARDVVATFVHGFVKDFDIDLLNKYELKDSTARRFVRGLRDDGVASLPVPYVCLDQPRVVALKPWHDVLIPDETTDIQSAPVIFRREYLSEFELRSRGLTEGWNADWVEEAAKQRGVVSDWAVGDDAAPGGVNWEFESLSQAHAGHNLIEVVTAFSWNLDDDDIPQRMMTTFHPQITAGPDGELLYASHKPLTYDHGMQPFVVLSRHNYSRTITSARGIPDLVGPRQRELKTQRDAIIDNTSITTVPPILDPSGKPGQRIDLSPAAINPVTQGREFRFMDAPRNGAPQSSEVSATILNEVAQDLGRMNIQVPPLRTQLYQTNLVQRFLNAWGQAFKQILALCRQYMSAEEYQRITGARMPWNTDPLTIERELDVYVSFDPRDLDADFLGKRLELIREAVIPMDRNGRLDSDKCVEFFTRLSFPSGADLLLSDPMNANQKMVDKVQQNILKISAGLPPTFITDADPTASAQLQIAQKTLSESPKLMQQYQQDPDFKEKVDMMQKNFDFVIGQGENRETGRTGVKPPTSGMEQR